MLSTCDPMRRITVSLFLTSLIHMTTAGNKCENMTCSSLSTNKQTISEFPNIELERRHFESSEICPSSLLLTNESDFANSLCTNKTDKLLPVEPSQLQGSRCFCDSYCHLYHDCCIDKIEQNDSINLNRFSCREISQMRSRFPVYVLQQCPRDFKDAPLRSLCENEAHELQEAGQSYHYLQSIPMHSNRTGILYRNVYCAFCNNDTQITRWNTHVFCNGDGSIRSTQNNVSSLDLIRQGRYNVKKNSWDVPVNGKLRTCHVIVEEFTDWIYLRKYGARLCKNAISTCPSSTELELLHKCQSYTAFVYLKKLGNYVFKNFHCALCNNVNPNDTTCYDPRFFLRVSTPSHAWMPLLFDFNFNGDENQVGGDVSSKCGLHNRQIWDPILMSCLNMTCGRLFKEVNGHCIRIQTNGDDHRGLNSTCRKIILTSDYFIQMENGNIYVNGSSKTYAPEEYEPYIVNDSVLTSVLVCESTDLLFDFDPNQVLLSELTLGISLVCLILHLITYSLLPKLRNRPGKILMSLTSSLTCGHFFFLIGTYSMKIFWLCYVDAILMFYGYLSAFFWMNVMAFDIYKTFSASGTRSTNDYRVFMKYSIYAWTSPFIIVLVSCLMDYILPPSLFSPKFAHGVCWFNQKRSLLVFFTVPLAFLLLTNLCFFFVTAFNIQKVAKQAKMANNFSETKRYFLYIKLAVILGLTWVFGFLAASMKVKALWYPFIILNGLQGTLIFLVFTVKRKVGMMLVVKLKLRSDKYALRQGKDDDRQKKVFYRSFSNITTLQTSLTSTLAPVINANPEDMLKAVRRLNTYDKDNS